MADEKIALTFYHSTVCPRCHFAGRALRVALRRFPGIELNKVEVLTHRDQARRDGVTLVPALVAGGRKLAGFVLTRRGIERFLESLANDNP